MRAFLLVLGILAVGFLSRSPSANGCGIPWRLNQPVSIDSEVAIIVWEPTTKTEHFIRRANFKTEAKDFGFLVPTPTEPKLADADDAIFQQLSQTTAAKIIHEKRVRQVYRSTDRIMTGSAAPSMPPKVTVEVLSRQKVAGYDAVILKANDAEALRNWLVKHGYDARPALAEWLKWYTDHNWIITAFKISHDGSQAKQLSGKTVRISFQTDVPFYPYREPADMRANPMLNGQRLLKVFFLSDKRYEGTLGQDGPWPARPVWANAIPEAASHLVFNGLGLDGDAKKELLTKKWHLTEFEDKSFPRPGTDEVYFRYAQAQDTLERPPIIVYDDAIEYIDAPSEAWDIRYRTELRVGAVLLALLVFGVIARSLLRKRNSALGQ